jgi:hypothetical protein
MFVLIVQLRTLRFLLASCWFICAPEVAPGIERGELGSEEETDYATTE